jgi:nucleoside-diphosphate-sugar epimerase
MSRILIVGCGYVGTALAELRVALEDEVWGLKRTAVESSSNRLVQADITAPETLAGLPADLDVVVFSASSGGFDDASYEQVYVRGVRNVIRALHDQRQRPRRFLFVSTTSVYGQTDGSIVNEDSPATPQIFAGTRMLEAEKQVLDSGFEPTILRLGGIYGPGRDRLIRSVREGSAVCYEDDPRFLNRNHRDDCAGALSHLIDLKTPRAIYLGVDHEPVGRSELLNWIADACGVQRPKVLPLSQAPVSRRPSNKRCSNQRLLDSGYVFRFPSYRSMKI